MSNEASCSPSSQLSIIADLSSTTLDFKKLCKELSTGPLPNYDHHYWHFGGLRSYTIPFRSDQDETVVESYNTKLKLLQNYLSLFPPFWTFYKKCEQQQQDIPSMTSPEVIRKNQRLGKFYSNNIFQIEYTAGALVQLNEYVYDPQTEIKDGWRLVFYHDKIDIDYGMKNSGLRKTLKAQMIDKCGVIMTEKNRLTFFINMNGNLVNYEGFNNNESLNTEQDSSTQKMNEATISFRRTAPRESQTFYSTIRIIISLPNDNNEDEKHSENLKRLRYCYTQFQEFFHRNHINDCFGIIQSRASEMQFSSVISSFMCNETMSFIKLYSWHMLLSIGYRFQQRLTDEFIYQMNLIENDDEFYQVKDPRHSIYDENLTLSYIYFDFLGITSYMATFK